MCAGFGVAAAVIFTRGSQGFLRCAGRVALSFVLAAVFLSMGAVCGLLSRSRTRAFGTALCVWFFFVVFYDLAAIGLAFVLRERTANLIIFVSLFGNISEYVQKPQSRLAPGQWRRGRQTNPRSKSLHRL